MAQGFKTGGRQKGSRNKKTVTLEKIGCEALAKTRAALELEPQIFDGDAHTLLMAIYRDMSHPIELRLEAAKAAIRFEKPALAALDARGTIENVHYAIADHPVTADEWDEKYTEPH